MRARERLVHHNRIAALQLQILQRHAIVQLRGREERRVAKQDPRFVRSDAEQILQRGQQLNIRRLSAVNHIRTAENKALGFRQLKV